MVDMFLCAGHNASIKESFLPSKDLYTAAVGRVRGDSLGVGKGAKNAFSTFTV